MIAFDGWKPEWTDDYIRDNTFICSCGHRVFRDSGDVLPAGTGTPSYCYLYITRHLLKLPRPTLIMEDML